MEVMVPSWTQYVLQQDQMTKSGCELIQQAESLHFGAKAPEARMYLGVNKELLSYKQKSLGGEYNANKSWILAGGSISHFTSLHHCIKMRWCGRLCLSIKIFTILLSLLPEIGDNR
jgi:hypothetical protein